MLSRNIIKHTTCQTRHVEYVMIIMHSDVKFSVHVTCIALHTCSMYGAQYVWNIARICVHHATHIKTSWLQNSTCVHNKCATKQSRNDRRLHNKYTLNGALWKPRWVIHSRDCPSILFCHSTRHFP